MGMIYHNVAAPGAKTVTTADITKAVYCGVAGDYYFYMNGAWTLFKGLLAGVIYPIACTGAKDSDDTDIEAGDLLYLR